METRALLKRMEALRALPESFGVTDLDADEIAALSGVIAVKDAPDWIIAWTDVKVELATREHIVRNTKPQARADRQARAKVQRT